MNWIFIIGTVVSSAIVIAGPLLIIWLLKW